jgi:hypothetical protein
MPSHYATVVPNLFKAVFLEPVGEGLITWPVQYSSCFRRISTRLGKLFFKVVNRYGFHDFRQVYALCYRPIEDILLPLNLSYSFFYTQNPQKNIDFPYRMCILNRYMLDLADICPYGG